MRISITGASGLIGTKLAAALTQRGDEVTKVSTRGDVDPAAVSGRDAVVHLAGENVAQRWTDDARARIHDSRVDGTRRLVSAINRADVRPKALISASAVGYYGPHGDEAVTEDTPPGEDFLAQVCRAWELEAEQAETRVVKVRTGVVLDASGGALAKMLLPFKLGDRRPRRRRAPVHAVDPRRRRGRHLPQRDRRALGGRGERVSARAGHQRAVQQGARTRAAPPGDRADPRRSRSDCSTATWR